MKRQQILAATFYLVSPEDSSTPGMIQPQDRLDKKIPIPPWIKTMKTMLWIFLSMSLSLILAKTMS